MYGKKLTKKQKTLPSALKKKIKKSKSKMKKR